VRKLSPPGPEWPLPLEAPGAGVPLHPPPLHPLLRGPSAPSSSTPCEHLQSQAPEPRPRLDESPVTPCRVAHALTNRASSPVTPSRHGVAARIPCTVGTLPARTGGSQRGARPAWIHIRVMDASGQRHSRQARSRSTPASGPGRGAETA
jgi:hypothetical protein